MWIVVSAPLLAGDHGPCRATRLLAEAFWEAMRRLVARVVRAARRRARSPLLGENMTREQLLDLLRAENGEWLASLDDDSELILANQQAAEEQDRLHEECDTTSGARADEPPA